MKIRKEIAYSYPTSTNASRLGFNQSGCFHVSVTKLFMVDGLWDSETFIPSPARGYLHKNDPELLEAFEAEQGDLWEIKGGKP